MLTGLDHVDIKVPDVEKFVGILKTLGFTEAGPQNPKRPQVVMKLPGAGRVLIEVEESADVDVPVLAHLAFLVDDLEEDVRRLREAGIEFTSDPRTTNSGRHLCNFLDEWGLQWQLVDESSITARQ